MGISMLTNGPVTGSTANGTSSRVSCRQHGNHLSQQATVQRSDRLILFLQNQKNTDEKFPTKVEEDQEVVGIQATQDVTQDRRDTIAIASSGIEGTVQEEKIFRKKGGLESEEPKIIGEEPLNLTQKNGGSESKRARREQEKDFSTTESSPKEIQEQVVTTSENSVQTSDSKQASDDDNKEECETAAKRLSQVLKWINNQGRKDVLLKDFAHSASCKKESCSHLCLMFRRVRRHVVGARHACKVLMLYSILLRLHVSSCNDSDCGLPACPALKATRPGKRTIESVVSSPKRTARQISNGHIISSRAVFEPRSPGGSLPGSQVNSPPSSPEVRDFDQCFPLNASESVQYMIVPVLPVVMLPSGKKVA